MSSYFDQFEQQLHQAARAQVQLRSGRREVSARLPARRRRTLGRPRPSVRVALPAGLAILLSVVIGIGALLFLHSKPHAKTVMQQSSGVSAAELAHGHWSVLPHSPLRGYRPLNFVWAGHELLELGGVAPTQRGPGYNPAGAAFDPSTGRWHRIASTPKSVGLAGAATVWIGSRLFVLGGPNAPTGYTHIAGLYDPATNRWTTTSRAPVNSLDPATAVWTGGRVLVAGMDRHERLEVASYDPASNTWRRLHPPIDPRHPPRTFALVAPNDGVLLWALWGRPTLHPTHNAREVPAQRAFGVDVFRLSSGGVWSTVTGSWPQRWIPDSPIFAGNAVLVRAGAQTLCGNAVCDSVQPAIHGYEVNPRTLVRTPIPQGPYDRFGPQVLWTGRAEIAINGTEQLDHALVPGLIAFWNPATGRWTRGPAAPLTPQTPVPAVWSGKRLYVMSESGHLLAYGP